MKSKCSNDRWFTYWQGPPQVSSITTDHHWALWLFWWCHVFADLIWTTAPCTRNHAFPLHLSMFKARPNRHGCFVISPLINYFVWKGLTRWWLWWNFREIARQLLLNHCQSIKTNGHVSTDKWFACLVFTQGQDCCKGGPSGTHITTSQETTRKKAKNTGPDALRRPRNSLV